MTPAFQAEILGKYPAHYFQCPACRLLQPANPHWLAESYSKVIAVTDVGIVARNRNNVRTLEMVLPCLGYASAKILDVGGGYGLLCRGMRDAGFDCYTSDIYCENLFAREFEPPPGFKAKVLVAFEVFEHIENPLTFTREKMETFDSDLFVFSTLTFDSPAPPPLDWWYYALETGQHVSLYHVDSLKMIAAKLGLHYFGLSADYHIFSRNPVAGMASLLLSSKIPLLRKAYGLFNRRRRSGNSLTTLDYENAKRRLTNPD